jgi:hypothetical protein
VILVDLVLPGPRSALESLLPPLLALKPVHSTTLTLPLPKLLQEGAMKVDPQIYSRKGQLISPYGMCTRALFGDGMAVAWEEVVGRLRELWEGWPGARGSGLAVEVWGDGGRAGSDGEEGAGEGQGERAEERQEVLFEWAGTKGFL